MRQTRQTNLRGGISLVFLLSLLLTAVALTFAFMAWAKFARSDKSLESFNELNEKIKAMAESTSESKQHHLQDLGKSNALIFFNEDVEIFEAGYRIQGKGVGGFAGATDIDVVIPRPKECTDSKKPCFCYVKTVKIDNSLFNWFRSQGWNDVGVFKYEARVICKQYDSNFYFHYRNCYEEVGIDNDCWKTVQMYAYYKDGKEYLDNKKTRFKSGLIIWRGPISWKYLGLAYSPDISPLKQRTIFLEKYRDYISLGVFDPVLSVGDKKIIDSMYLNKTLGDCVKGFCKDPIDDLKGVMAGPDPNAWELNFKTEKGKVKMELKNETAKEEHNKIKEEYTIETDEMYIVPYDENNGPDFIKQQKKNKIELRYKQGEIVFDGKTLVTIGNTFTLQPGLQGAPSPQDLKLYFYYKTPKSP